MNASDELSRKFAENHPADAARVLEHARPEETAPFLEAIPIAAAANILQHMNARLAAASLSAVDVERAARIIEGMPLYHAAHVLRHSNPTRLESLIERLGEKVARPLRRLLRYRDGTAGALADPQALTLPSDMSVGDAQRQLRRLAGEAFYYVYVTDRDHRLVGVVTIRQLLLARPRQTLESIMQREPIRLPATSDLAGIAVNKAWQEFDMLPVVDKAGAFLGVIRHKTIRRRASTADGGEVLANAMDLAMSIADMYWKSLAGLAAGIAVAAATQRDAVPDHSRR
jgi:magnesium transporter